MLNHGLLNYMVHWTIPYMLVWTLPATWKTLVVINKQTVLLKKRFKQIMSWYKPPKKGSWEKESPQEKQLHCFRQETSGIPSPQEKKYVLVFTKGENRWIASKGGVWAFCTKFTTYLIARCQGPIQVWLPWQQFSVARELRGVTGELSERRAITSGVVTQKYEKSEQF